MAPDPDADELAQQLFEAARGERPAPAVKRDALRAATVSTPSRSRRGWLVAAVVLASPGVLLLLGGNFEFIRGDGAGGGPEGGAISAEPIRVRSRSVETVSRPPPVVRRVEDATGLPVASAVPTNPAPNAAGASNRSVVQRVPAASLEEELQMLDGARQALLGGDAGAALARLSQYERTATRRHLGAEATVLRVQILAASGRGSEASELASQFVATHPNSPLVDRAKSFIQESKRGEVNEVDQKQGVGP
ncbi:MAG TPA: hypothetical protein VFU02_24190 [Polyangiaceae bacterium]|nr:hypothetical protein [Polyangiaceae bacterium]